MATEEAATVVKSANKLKSAYDKFKGLKPVAGTVNYMKAHPGRAAGLGVLGASNVAGLFDNNKLLGQIGGAALGGLTSAGLAAAGVPWAHGVNLAWAPMIGGTLGSMFDALRAKNEQEKLQAASQYGYQRQPY